MRVRSRRSGAVRGVGGGGGDDSSALVETPPNFVRVFVTSTFKQVVQGVSQPWLATRVPERWLPSA